MENNNRPKSSLKVAEYLSELIERSEKTQKQIAQEAGFQKPNMLSMLKSGETKLPFDRIPALAGALDACEGDLLDRAMREYEPNLLDLIERWYVRKLGLADRREGSRCTERVASHVSSSVS